MNDANISGSKRKHSEVEQDATAPSNPAVRVKTDADSSSASRPSASSEGAHAANSSAEVAEDGIPLVANPTKDIMGELEKALEMDLEFKGAFAWSKTYNDAPNPALRVDGLGTIGLPLGDYLAAGLAQICVSDAQNDVNSTTLDTARVHFDNPAWGAWIDALRQTVCLALGTGDPGLGAQAVLRSVVLRRPGATLLSSATTPNTFATMVVMLPGLYVGGSTVLTYRGETFRVDLGQSSLLCTNVVAWYNGVGLDSDTITSGHCLALLYDLVQPTGFVFAPPPEPFAVTKLRHILLSWKQREDGAGKPEKIMIILKKDYSLPYDYSRDAKPSKEPRLTAARLKGQGARVFRALDGLAQELGFRLGLCSLWHKVSGDRKGRWRSYAYDTSDDDSEIEMVGGRESDTEWNYFVDADGKELPCWLSPEDDEIIPHKWEEDLEFSDNFEHEIESRERVTYTYDRTVIVLWPENGPFQTGWRES
ncbi:hypothetical protein EXIGLDRAFT_718290 [Exidia glandulosa HHB12029]|uniref:Uncharacterized protein n=1 Tax=Exidia glandulosa HHB12029 TaxID=1314781 RepID=A0A165HV59_EXIGL|nr:hypothetical protein EXIGLDRAFT_718290 [Exidia glandulosa HHB12029]